MHLLSTKWGTLYAAGEEVGAVGLEGVAVVSKAVHNDCQSAPLQVNKSMILSL